MPDDSRLSRRAALGLAVLGLGSAGAACSVRNPLSSTSRRSLRSSGVAPDVKVAADALDRLRAAEARVTATVKRFPALGPRLAPFADLHRAHAAALESAVPGGGEGATDGAPSTEEPGVPPRRPLALTSVLSGERDVHASLVGLALRAESGDFARLLASMAAATSQRLAVAAR